MECGDKSLKHLKAGEIEAFLDGNSLRYISVFGIEILRMVYSAVRIEGWLTVEPEVIKSDLNVSNLGFELTTLCVYKTGNIHFEAVYRILGRSDNSVIFEMEGTALTSFRKNRIGYCILHPVEGIRGQKCIVLHSNGVSETDFFPYFISPYQPFRDIKELNWTISNRLSVNLIFSGDIFEMEDQRNWTDNSFKTYCTPLDHPYPVILKKGEKIYQKVEINVDILKKTRKKEDEISIEIQPETVFTFPRIGIGRSSRVEPLDEVEINILKSLPFNHYRLELYLFEKGWKEKAKTAFAESEKLGYPVELALFFDVNAEKQLKDFRNLIESDRPRISMVHVFDSNSSATPKQLIEITLPCLRRILPESRIGGGTNANFAQINRADLYANFLDFVSYSIHPQEHANDNLSLIENLEGQKYSIENLSHRFEGKDIVISPVTLKRRFNANVENYETNHQGSDLPPQIDPRQSSFFAAQWTLGSLKYLMESCARDITYYETVGERGIIQGNIPSKWKKEFPSSRGMIFPLFHVFSYILRKKNPKILRSLSSRPLSVEVLALRQDNLTEVVLINFSSSESCVKFQNLSTEAKMKSVTSAEDISIISNWKNESEKSKVNLNESIHLPACSISLLQF